MVKPVRESELAIRPNCEGIGPPQAAVPAVHYVVRSVAGTRHALGGVKARLVAWQRLVGPALMPQTQHSGLDHGSTVML